MNALENRPQPTVNAQPPAPAASPPPVKREIKALDALRFFGVLWVVIDHAHGGFPFLSHFETYALSQAVSFFFVLSGFVLAYNYFDISGKAKVLSFYVARWARLWPIHVFGVVLLICLMPGLFKPSGNMWPVFITNVALLQSAVPILKYFYSYNAPSWTSSTLMLVYLAFPALMFLARKSWLLLLAVTTGGVVGSIGLASALSVPEADPLKVSTLGLLYVSPITRMFDLALGIIAAIAYRNFLQHKKPGTLLGTIMELGALGAVYYIAANSFQWRWLCLDVAGPQASYWLQYCGFALIGCLLLVGVFSMESGLISRFFRLKVFSYLGDVSFCIYVLHTVLLVYAMQILKIDPTPVSFFSYLGILIVFSAMMYRWVEIPSRDVAKNFCKKYIYGAKSAAKAS